MAGPTNPPRYLQSTFCRMRIYIPKPLWGNVPLLRQTSQFSGIVGNAQYCVHSDPSIETDFILTLEPRTDRGPVTGSKHVKTVFVHMENQDIWKPSSADLDAIDIIISPYREVASLQPGCHQYIRHYPCVPWFYGISFAIDAGLMHRPLKSKLELDEMMETVYPKKNKLLSIIVSGKRGTYGHKWRQEVAHAIKTYFGPLADIYGFGHNPIPDKRIAIDSYLYSIVIENSCEDYYITEKIVDCLIGWSIPIYAGSAHIDRLFDEVVPSIPYGCSPEHALNAVKMVISRPNICHEDLSRIRMLAMTKLNLFSVLPDLLSNS